MGAVAEGASRRLRAYLVRGAPGVALAGLLGCFPRDDLSIYSRDWGVTMNDSGGTGATPNDLETPDASGPGSNDGSTAGAGGAMEGAEASAGGSSGNGMAARDDAGAADAEADAGDLAEAGGSVAASLSDVGP